MASSLIIFDCDGTLVDSEGLHTTATFALFNEILGKEAYAPELHGEFFMGRSWPDICTMVSDEHAIVLPDDIDARYVQAMLQAMEEPEALQACHQAIRILDYLSDRHEVCVASNGERETVIKALEVTGLMPHFSEDTIFTKDQVNNPKPAPDLFLHACQSMGYEPKNTLVIEDSVTGVQAARAAGMKVLGFVGTAPDRPARSRALIQAGASHVMESLLEINRHVWSPRPALFHTFDFG